MNPNKKSRKLKLFSICAAVLGLVLRAVLYATGIDGRGLLTVNHPAAVALWGLSGAFVIALLVLCRGITGPEVYADAYPASASAAAGCFALGAALLVTGLGSYGSFQLSADFFIWALGLCSGAGMIALGVCRLLGKKPYFLMNAAFCLYIALRMVAQYRQWSAHPQLQDYAFYIMAYGAVMMTAYQHAAFDTGLGKHRALWICSLGTVYLCGAALPRCEEALLLSCFALWAITNLTALKSRKRRIRPVLQADTEIVEE